MVEFQDYPNVLIRMLNNCIKEPHSHLVVFVMQHDVNARLDFIQVGWRSNDDSDGDDDDENKYTPEYNTTGEHFFEHGSFVQSSYYRSHKRRKVKLRNSSLNIAGPSVLKRNVIHWLGPALS